MKLKPLALLVLVTALMASPTLAYAAGTKTLRPDLVSLSTPVNNAERGQYRWLGAEPQGSDAVANDVYYRDQVYWGRIEPRDNQWDFSFIEAGLSEARTRGGKFSFRVMAYCPGCWMNYRSDFPPVTPPFLPRQANTDIPAWNDPEFLAQWDQLVAELSRRYAHDPALGSIDVGGYGAYGEWHVFEGEKITDANGLRMVRTVAKAFPRHWVLLNSMTSVPFYRRALDSNPNLGMRTDNLGCENMYSMVAVSPELQSYWRTRPFHTEWCRQADLKLGFEQVQKFHISTVSSGNMPWNYGELSAEDKRTYEVGLNRTGYRYAVKQVATKRFGSKTRMAITVENQGSAPTYHAWRAKLVLTNAKGSAVKRLNIDLCRVVPGKKTFVNTFRLKPGRYRTSIIFEDAEKYLAPLALANKRRDAAGGYELGSIRVK